MAGKAITIRICVISAAQVKIGMRIMLMPGARMLKMVDDEVDAGGHRRHAEHLQAKHPEVDVAARVPGLLGQRRVAVPALIRRRIEEPAHVEDDRRRPGRSSS